MNRKLSPFWTLFILTGLNLFNYLDLNVLADVLEPVQAQFNLSDEQGGRLNNALTIFYVALPVGSALGYIIGGQIAAHWGWRYAFIWAGLPGLLLALSLLPFQEPQRGLAEGLTEQVRLPKLKDVQTMLRLTDFHLIVWGYAYYTFAMGAFAFWGPSYLHRVHHLAKSSDALFLGAVVVVAGLI